MNEVTGYAVGHYKYEKTAYKPTRRDWSIVLGVPLVVLVVPLGVIALLWLFNLRTILNATWFVLPLAVTLAVYALPLAAHLFNRSSPKATDLTNRSTDTP